MSTELQQPTSASSAEYDQYRAMSAAAVAALTVAVLSFAALLSVSLLVVPLVGVMLSVYALFTVSRRRHELTGTMLAGIALTLSLLLLVGCGALHTTIYLTEVPEGYQRIGYRDLDYSHEDKKAGNVVPSEALALNGEKVFIKGYIYPGAQKRGIKRFLLVRDKGDCCFGGDPKITDRIQVTLENDLRLQFDTRLHKLAGVLRVAPDQNAVDAGGAVLYHLDANHLK